jgi:acyl-CoA thioester hydrolase
MLTEHQIEFRVRYQETDGQGHVHHANYLTWFEMGRVELLRAAGHSYRELEASGLLFVVVEMQVRYYSPALFDDIVRLKTTVLAAKGARIVHRYEVFRGADLLAEGQSTIACVDGRGRPARLPAWLTLPSAGKASPPRAARSLEGRPAQTPDGTATSG